MPGQDTPAEGGGGPGSGWSRVLAGIGLASGLAAVILDQREARSAAAQVWPAFVLVAGLLLVGLVADQDGLFAAAGHRLAELAPNPLALFAGVAAMVAAVTAVLNLDTSVVFVTPVLVHAARRRDQSDVPLLVGCLLLSNAGSLLLPGSNLTNLIVLGHFHLSGGQYLARMALPWAVSVLVTAGVVAILERRSMRPGESPPRLSNRRRAVPFTFGLGVGGPGRTVLIIVLRSPALPVAAIGMAAVSVRVLTRKEQAVGPSRCWGYRSWSGCSGWPPPWVRSVGPGRAPPSCSPTSTPWARRWWRRGRSALQQPAGRVAPLLSGPAPPLLAAHRAGHRADLFVTGSLAWMLWRRAVSSSGSKPPVRRAVVLGLVSVPLAMAAALGLLAATGSLVISPVWAGLAQPIFRRSTTNTRVSLALIPAPGEGGP